MSPTAAALFLLSAVVLYLALAGRLPAVWAALQGNGISQSATQTGGASSRGAAPLPQ